MKLLECLVGSGIAKGIDEESRIAKYLRVVRFTVWRLVTLSHPLHRSCFNPELALKDNQVERPLDRFRGSGCAERLLRSTQLGQWQAIVRETRCSRWEGRFRRVALGMTEV